MRLSLAGHHRVGRSGASRLFVQIGEQVREIGGRQRETGGLCVAAKALKERCTRREQQTEIQALRPASRAAALLVVAADDERRPTELVGESTCDKSENAEWPPF